MSGVPKFTKRAALQIEHLRSTFAKDLPRNEYMNCVAWEVGFDANFIARPMLGLHETKLVPDNLQIECHGVRLAYNLPDRVMATLHSSVLDFDGKQFVFVDVREVNRLKPRRRRRLNTDEKRGLKVGAIRTFMRQYGRKAQKNTEPNDRRHDAEVEKAVKRMKPDELDKLLRDDED